MLCCKCFLLFRAISFLYVVLTLLKYPSQVGDIGIIMMERGVESCYCVLWRLFHLIFMFVLMYSSKRYFLIKILSYKKSRTLSLFCLYVVIHAQYHINSSCSISLLYFLIKVLSYKKFRIYYTLSKLNLYSVINSNLQTRLGYKL